MYIAEVYLSDINIIDQLREITISQSLLNFRSNLYINNKQKSHSYMCKSNLSLLNQGK